MGKSLYTFIVGQQVNAWEVTKIVEPHLTEAMCLWYHFGKMCGNKVILRNWELHSDHKKSCGCMQKCGFKRLEDRYYRGKELHERDKLIAYRMPWVTTK